MIKVADLFEITLSNDKKAIGHYVFRDKQNGPLIQVFDYIANKDAVRIEDAVKKPYLFPPVITGLNAAVRTGLWPIIGKKAVINFVYPKFISSHWNINTGEVKNWFLYDQKGFTSLGPALPEEFKDLEYLVVWSPFDVISRIETGIIPYPFGDMIKNNRFTIGKK